MQRKNDRFLYVIAFICTGIFYFQPLLAVYRSTGKRLAAGRQSSPITISKPIMPATPAPEQEKIKPISAQKELEEINDAQAAPETEEIEEEEKALEDQNKIPTPTDFFSKAYALATPLIIASLDTALGVAIATGTKVAIKNTMTRHTFRNMLSDAQDKAPAFAAAYDQNLKQQLQRITQSDAYKENPKKFNETVLDIENFLDQPIEYKKNHAVRTLLKEQKIKNPEAMEKATSGQSIFADVIYTTAITAIINTLGTFIGYGTKLSLRSIPQQE